MTGMEYILCVGDSLTFGGRDEYHSSYPSELSRLYWEQKKKTVYCVNHSTNGITSGQLLSNIYSIAKSCPQAKVALVLIGTNDTQIDQQPDIYKDNLRQIIAVLKETYNSIGLGILPPIIGPGLPNYPKDGQKQVDVFNDIIIKSAEEYGCFLADFRNLGKYIIDTVHLNHNGYKKMAEIWYEAIEKLGIIK